MIDDVCQEIIDSDSERFMFLALHCMDGIGKYDFHELACEYAEKRGRDEPNYEDYGDAVRDAIDSTENDMVNEKWRAEQDREREFARQDCENHSALPRAE